MRVLLLCTVLLGLLASCCVFAQDDDDGWGEITSLMNAVSNANRQLTNRQLTTPGTLQSGLPLGLAGQAGYGQILGQRFGGGVGGLTPGFMQGLAGFSQAYAQVLGSVDGAFEGTPGAYDPFAAGAPNILQQQLDLWQRSAAAQQYQRRPNLFQTRPATGALGTTGYQQYLPQLNSLYNAYRQFE